MEELLVVGGVDLLLSGVGEPGNFGLGGFILFLCPVKRILKPLFFVLRLLFLPGLGGQGALVLPVLLCQECEQVVDLCNRGRFPIPLFRFDFV